MAPTRKPPQQRPLPEPASIADPFEKQTEPAAVPLTPKPAKPDTPPPKKPYRPPADHPWRKPFLPQGRPTPLNTT